MRGYITLLLLAIFGVAHSYAQSELKSDSVFASFLEQQNIAITNNNDIELLPNGATKFEDLFDHIKQAKHHIHLEYFNFRNDSIAKLTFDLLAEKAKEGVEVRALFDAFGNFSNNKPLKKKHLKSIRQRGIEIVKFDPMRFPFINHAMHRDHRKIVVIDGVIGYTGGMNIADYYINGLPKIGPWYDMHLRVEGSAVKHLQEIFINTWNAETGQHVGGPQYYPEPLDIPQNLHKPTAIVDRWPTRTPKIMRESYKTAILAAQHTIRIINPYFLPTRSIRKALKKALKKGVKVEIIIPLKSDIPFTPAASFHVGNKLRKHGADVYLFNEGFHHTKIMTIDETFCTVGSANLNSRSLRYDYETNAFIFSKEITAELDTLFLTDINRSIKLTEELWKNRSCWNKFIGWVGYQLTPFL